MTARVLSAEDFERQYAERSHMSVDKLREYSRVVPCGPDTHGCDDPTCEGWGAVPLQSDLCGECGRYDFTHPLAGCPGFTRERRWPRDFSSNSQEQE